jgi:lysophospholipase L1-like esterase
MTARRPGGRRAVPILEPCLLRRTLERMRGRLLTLVATILVLLLTAGLGASLGQEPPAGETEPTRIMIFGDSVAHGTAGDWTWRYRLDRWLDAQGLDADLVGPYTGLHDDPPGDEPPVNDSHAYIDADFDTDHASLWGAELGKPEIVVADLVRDHQVDVLVLARGFNDIFWHSPPGYSPVEDVVARVEQVVADARGSNPDVDIVLVTLTQTWVRHVPEFNTRLDGLAASLDTPESRVVVAHADHDFSRDDTWDGSHATSVGEVKIAAAVADALATVGVGEPYPRPLPEVPLGPRIPPVLEVIPGDREASLSWIRSPGATSHRVWRRSGDSDDPAVLVAEVDGSGWLDTGLDNATDYTYQVQPIKGTTQALPDAWSAPVTVVPLVDVPADAPLLTVRETRHKYVRLGWEDALGVRDYLVWWREEGADWSVRSATGRDLVLTPLRAGVRHEFSVAAVGRRGAGPRSAPVSVVVEGTPPSSAGVSVAAIDEHGTARVEWRAQPEVTGWSVALSGPDRAHGAVLVPAGQTSMLMPGLVPGASYEVSVTGFVDLVSGPSDVVTFGVPLVSAAPWSRIKRPTKRRFKARVGFIPGADSYEFATVSTRRCRALPSDGRFRVRGTPDARRQRSVFVRRGALWVRWRGLRSSVPGLTDTSSYACLEVQRRRASGRR